MSFFEEYALLFAVGLPVFVIVGMQVFLFMLGERGTLLIPGFNKYPSIQLRDPETIAKPVSVTPRPVPANDMELLLAKSSNDEAHPRGGRVAAGARKVVETRPAA